MICKREKTSLIIKIFFTSLFTIIILASVRIFNAYPDVVGNTLFYSLLVNEIVFSITSFIVILLIVYVITNKELSSISKKARKYAFTDALTGLYNRHYLNDFLEKFSSLRKEDSNFAIVFIDIDDFKSVNDIYGHKTGDCILKNIAQRLESLTRTKDILCRFGGEEFIIIFSGISRDDILVKAEQIRAEIESMNFNCKQQKITVSMGLNFGNRDDDIHQIIEEADMALYRAKSSGKNCVKVFEKK